MAKLVDALVLGTSRAICGGSSPLLGTRKTAEKRFLCVLKKVWETFDEQLRYRSAEGKSYSITNTEFVEL